MQQCMTSERYQKIQSVLAKRQTDLTLLLEEVHKPHNVSAVIRSADAVGVHDIHAVWEEHTSLRKGTSLGSQIWVKTQHHETVHDAVSHLKQQDMQVLVTHLDDSAVDFREIDYTKPTAIILGQEKTGATDEAVDIADQSILIPMVGMVQSLNVSVAAAIILYEAQRQRELAGMYNNRTIDDAEAQDVLFEGGFPVLFKECVRRNLPFPRIDENGCIDAPEQWWQALQYSDKK
jgi:tRNA (guanosine-2'-O-)-methyltransferase